MPNSRSDPRYSGRAGSPPPSSQPRRGGLSARRWGHLLRGRLRRARPGYDDKERPSETSEIETGGLANEKEHTHHYQQDAEPDEDPAQTLVATLVVHAFSPLVVFSFP